jgi:hypothetical protein
MALEDKKYVVCILQPYEPPIIILKRSPHFSYTCLTSTDLSNISNIKINYVCNNINVNIQYNFSNFPDISKTPYLILDDKYYYKGSIKYQKLTDEMKLFIDSFAPFIISHQQCVNYNIKNKNY